MLRGRPSSYRPAIAVLSSVSGEPNGLGTAAVTLGSDGGMLGAGLPPAAPAQPTTTLMMSARKTAPPFT
jgi:hypothetical protein